MASETGGVEVGKGAIPYGAIGVAVLVIALLVVAVAYASRTPFGAEIGAAADLESAVNEHFAKNEKRFPMRKTYYNCAGFMDSMFSGKQDVAVAVEQGAWRPGVTPDGSTGNLVIAKAAREDEGPWRVSSRVKQDGTYDPSPKDAEDLNHPCNQ